MYSFPIMHRSVFQGLQLAFTLGAFSLLLTTGFTNATQCRSWCGKHTIKYPFGLQEGCGHPEFQLTCNEDNDNVELRLNSKLLTVKYLDYSNNKIIVRDSQMSDCSGLRQEDPGFRLDTAGTNYSVIESTVLLLNCLAFQREIQVNPLNSQYDCRSPACVAFVTSCLMNSAPTTCCQLTSPVNLDLQPLQCQSYTSAYSPGRPMYDASRWSYGLVLEWDFPPDVLQACMDCQKSNGVCGYNVSDVQSNFLCICKYGNSSDRCQVYFDEIGDSEYADCFNNSCSHAQQTLPPPKGKDTDRHTSSKALVVGLVTGAAIIIIPAVGLLCFLFFNRMKQHARIEATDIVSNDSFTNEETNNELLQIVLQHIGSSPTTLFSYSELKDATNSFSENRLLGDGGHGIVYLAKFCDGRMAAVKTLNYQNHRRFEQFHNEVRILSKVRHTHLVQLLGFCLEGRDLILVYELLPNGTLEEHLLGSRGLKPMPWDIRVTIAIEVAEALAYLHTCMNPPIVHRDVKSSNILLDNAFHAKLADFGLSRLVPMEATHVSTAPQGTLGYLDPEYHQTFRLTDKSDVYSFGVVLMELISSRRALDLSKSRDEINLCSLAISKMQSGSFHDIVDSYLQIDKRSTVRIMVDKVAQLAFRCLAASRDQRPNMTEVLAELQRMRAER
eukprot:Gb_26122 [translate_table: standard]